MVLCQGTVFEWLISTAPRVPIALLLSSENCATAVSCNRCTFRPTQVKLNNAEMQLAAREAEEETAVLVALTELVRRAGDEGNRGLVRRGQGT